MGRRPTNAGFCPTSNPYEDARGRWSSWRPYTITRRYASRQIGRSQSDRLCVRSRTVRIFHDLRSIWAKSTAVAGQGSRSGGHRSQNHQCGKFEPFHHSTSHPGSDCRGEALFPAYSSLGDRHPICVHVSMWPSSRIVIQIRLSDTAMPAGYLGCPDGKPGRSASRNCHVHPATGAATCAGQQPEKALPDEN